MEEMSPVGGEGVDQVEPAAAPRFSGIARRLAAAVVVLGLSVIAVAAALWPRHATSDSAQRLVTAAADATVRRGTFGFTGELHTDGGAIGGGFVIRVSGVVDLIHRTEDVATAMSSAPGGPGVALHRIRIGNDDWTRPVSGIGVRGSPQLWVHSRVRTERGPTFDNDLDPAAVLQMLSDGDIRFRRVGRETIRQVGTTRYRAVRRSTGGPSSVDAAGSTVEAWIDGDGLVRRVRSTIDIRFGGSPFAGQSQLSLLSGSTSVELFDFGLATMIVPPPVDEAEHTGAASTASTPSAEPASQSAQLAATRWRRSAHQGAISEFGGHRSRRTQAARRSEEPVNLAP